VSWLVDGSAYWRLGRCFDAEEWASRIERGLLRIAAVTLLELGYSSRSAGELRGERSRPPLVLMPVELLAPGAAVRALQVQDLLAERGYHRAVSVPDLLVAATAELGGLTVLHFDKDYDLIAEITGQSVERLRIPNHT
jgi:predicted nucleic acid-binding protein